MKHIILFSGGVSSSYVAKMVLDEVVENGGSRADVILLHTPTYSENHDADTFRHQVARYLGLPITEWGDGRDIWELTEDNHCLPSFFIPFCTQQLKQKQKESYYKYLAGLGEDFVEYVGYGAEEGRRVQKATARNEVIGRRIRFPIYEKQIPSAEIRRIIVEEWGLKLPKAYEDLSHNNCIPCFKAGKGAWKVYWLKYREQFNKAVALEEQMEHTVFKGISLKELANKWEHEAEEDALQITFDEIPCECWV